MKVKDGAYYIMKNLFMVLLTIACGVILLLGNLHWKEKTTFSGETVKADAESGSGEEAVDAFAETDSLHTLTENWPEAALEAYQTALEEERVFKIVLMGSQAMGVDEGGWSVTVKDELENTFGETVEVQLKSYDTTTREFIDTGEHEKAAAEKPDFLIWEPFTLTDNGKVRIEHSHEYINETITAVIAANPEAVVVLQPPYPLFKANFYPVQVNALEKYASQIEVPYLNHWEAWPDMNDEELKNYLVGEPSAPNEMGHQVWADYLLDYLVSK